VHDIGQFGVGKHLAELCREEYPRFVNICLWIIAELAVISDDIPEGWSIRQLVFLLVCAMMTSLKVDRLFQYCSAGHSLCIQHTAQDPSVGWSHPHGVQHALASWSAEIWGMVLYITFIHTEEVRIQHLEDGLA